MKFDIISMITGSDYDYRKKCKLRIGLAFLLLLLGVWAIMKGLVLNGQNTYNYVNAASFYLGTGFGLSFATVITVVRNLRYLSHEETLKKREIYEKDERNRLLGLRCWSYAGYTAFIGLYVGILVWGSRDEIVLCTLLAVMGGFGALLLLYRILLSRVM